MLNVENVKIHATTGVTMTKTIEFGEITRKGDGIKSHIVISKISCIRLFPKFFEQITNKNCKWIIRVELGSEDVTEYYDNWQQAEKKYNEILDAINGQL